MTTTLNMVGRPFICMACGRIEVMVDGAERLGPPLNCPNCLKDYRMKLAGPQQRITLSLNDLAQRRRKKGLS